LRILEFFSSNDANKRDSFSLKSVDYDVNERAKTRMASKYKTLTFWGRSQDQP